MRRTRYHHGPRAGRWRDPQGGKVQVGCEDPECGHVEWVEEYRKGRARPFLEFVCSQIHYKSMRCPKCGRVEPGFEEEAVKNPVTDTLRKVMP